MKEVLKLKLVLEALERLHYEMFTHQGEKAIATIKEALAQPEQEPVAYLCENAVGHKYFRWKKPSSTYKPIALYTTPPQRTWIDLTDDEVTEIVGSSDYRYDVARAAEAKSKEKNI